MKNLILIVILFLSLDCKIDNSINNLKSDSIVDSEKTWYISEYPNCCPSSIWPHKIVFGKDTIINSNSYKEVLDYRGDSIESNSKVKSLGFMRETTDKKVYWYVGFFGRPPTDILLYDFNANINDTIDNWIVTKVDSIEILDIKRKRITLTNCEHRNKYWIEGNCDMTYLLYYPSRSICYYETGIMKDVTGNSGYKINCVIKGGEIIYKDSSSVNCWIYKE